MISTKGRYGLRVMIDLAEHADENLVPLKEISERQDISKKYLEIIVKKLVEGNFVIGISGKGGGYRLTRSPEDYTLGEVLSFMEGSLATVSCLKDEKNSCPRSGNCKTLPLWKEYDKMVQDFFYSRTLADLL